VQVISKSMSNEECVVRINLDRWVLQQYQDVATVEYLKAQAGLKEEWTAYLSGQTYPLWGTGRGGAYAPFKLRRWE
jgi:hypothetical protein